jgi:hypothetical protein
MYKRQVTKLNVSARVVDAQMPENPYTYREMESHLLSYDSDHETGEEAQRRTVIPFSLIDSFSTERVASI